MKMKPCLLNGRGFSTALSAMKRGRGGRSSFNGIVATVFGATGFLGSHILSRLGRNGTQIILPYRCCDYEVTRYRIVGDLGQVLFHPFHLLDEESIRKSMKYSNVVINLVGRDWETNNFGFEDVHVAGARRIARLAREMGVRRFVHFSALNAAAEPKTHLVEGGSKFLRSKYFGECAVREEFPNAVVFRPSDIFGLDDRFLWYFSHWYRKSFLRTIPLWRAGEATFKMPVYVDDVVDGVMRAVLDESTDGKTYQAVGPRKYKLSELIDYMHAIERKDHEWGYRRHDLKYAFWFHLKMYANQFPLLSRPINAMVWDRVERECVTDHVDIRVPTLEDLGVTPLTFLENEIDYECKRFRAHSYYTESPGEFPRPPPPPHY